MVCRGPERVRGAEHKRIPGELWVMCQLSKEENFGASVNVGSELLYSRKVATDGQALVLHVEQIFTFLLEI